MVLNKTWLLFLVLFVACAMVSCSDDENVDASADATSSAEAETSEDSGSETEDSVSFTLSDEKRMDYKLCPDKGKRREKGMKNPVKIHGVYLDSCNNKVNPKCPLKRGSSETLLINMTATQDETDFKEKVHGRIGFFVPFATPVRETSACVSSGVCPMKAGDNGLYAFTIPIAETYPEIPVIIKWVLERPGGTKGLCILIRTELK